MHIIEERSREKLAEPAVKPVDCLAVVLVVLGIIDASFFYTTLAVGPIPMETEKKAAVFHFSYSLIIGPLLFLLMSSIAGGEWE